MKHLFFSEDDNLKSNKGFNEKQDVMNHQLWLTTFLLMIGILVIAYLSIVN